MIYLTLNKPAHQLLQSKGMPHHRIHFNEYEEGLKIEEGDCVMVCSKSPHNYIMPVINTTVAACGLREDKSLDLVLEHKKFTTAGGFVAPHDLKLFEFERKPYYPTAQKVSRGGLI